MKLKMKSEKEKEKMQLKMKSEKEKGKMKLKMKSGAGKGEREINIFRKSLTCSGNQEPANVVITIVISLTTCKYFCSLNLSRLLSSMKTGFRLTQCCHSTNVDAFSFPLFFCLMDKICCQNRFG